MSGMPASCFAPGPGPRHPRERGPANDRQRAAGVTAGTPAGIPDRWRPEPPAVGMPSHRTNRAPRIDAVAAYFETGFRALPYWR
jgi:hypothetical protein